MKEQKQDPYNKFYEYMQNIQFGTPFIEHVAKKTYIKTKPDTIEYKDKNKLYHQKKHDFDDE